MASGDTLGTLYPAMSENQSGCSFTQRNGALLLAFNDTTDETCEFPFTIPSYYAGGGFTCTFVWASEDQTTGNCVWDMAWKSFTDDADDLDSKAFAAVNSVTATTASATGEFDYSNITFTDGADSDSVLANEYCRIQVRRDANNASDTLTNDAQLVCVIIKET